jgi:hypothetical protein
MPNGTVERPTKVVQEPKPQRAQQSNLCHMPGDEVVAFQWVRIDKQLALQFLHSNVRNRPMNKERVERYARDMVSGQWWHGSVLNIGSDGIFQNGQHRLQAVVASDTVHWFGIIKGLPPRAQDTMDQGMVRQFSGQLRIRGEKNAVTLAAATRVVWFYIEAGHLTGGRVTRQPSITELSELLELNGALRDCLAKQGPFIGLSGGMVSGFRYLASMHDPDLASEFLSQVRTGGHELGDPIRALQDRLTVDMQKRDKPDSVTRSAFLIKTWNAWLKGVEVRNLRWAPFGPKAEPMPLIDGCPIIPRTKGGDGLA